MEIILIAIAIVVYILLIYSYFFKQNTLLISLLISLCVFHDYIFIHFSFYFSETPTYIVKSWQEYTILLSLTDYFFRFLGKNKYALNKFANQLLITLIFLSAIGVAASIQNKDSTIDIVLGIRNYIIPLLLPNLLLLNNKFEGINFKKIVNYLIFLSLVGVVYGTYQRIYFINEGGDTIKPDFSSTIFYHNVDAIFSKTLWYHKYFELDYMIMAWFDRVRDGALRSSSYFVSPLIFSLFLNMCLTFSFVNIFTNKKSKKIIYIIASSILLYGVYISQVRAALFFFLISILVIIYIKYLPSYKKWIVLIPLSIIILSFFGISIVNDLDYSARYRLIQYSMMIKNFKIIGYGLGSKYATVTFDSLIISSIYAFGIFGLLFFYYHYKIYCVATSQRLEKNNNRYFSFVVILACFMAFFYFAFFQYTLSSGPLKVFYFLIFLKISNVIYPVKIEKV